MDCFEESWNPLLNGFEQARAANLLSDEVRVEFIARYGFAVCTDAALRAIADVSPRGVVEIGAGTGYWARLLHNRGVDVVAFDVAPPSRRQNKWFAGTTTWFPVELADETIVSRHLERTLLMVWPTRDQVWPADAAELFYAVGGTTFVFVGEGPGGRTGDDRFHAILGHLDRCYGCAHGVVDHACIIGTPVLWRPITEVPLPNWPGTSDTLRIYTRIDEPVVVI